MKLELLFVTVVAFISWSALLSLECYWGGSEPIYTHPLKTAGPPYPDDKADNIFWFLQVRLLAN